MRAIFISNSCIGTKSVKEFWNSDDPCVFINCMLVIWIKLHGIWGQGTLHFSFLTYSVKLVMPLSFWAVGPWTSGMCFWWEALPPEDHTKPRTRAGMYIPSKRLQQSLWSWGNLHGGEMSIVHTIQAFPIRGTSRALGHSGVEISGLCPFVQWELSYSGRESWVSYSVDILRTELGK